MNSDSMDPNVLRDSIREVLNAEWSADRLIRHYDSGASTDANLWAQAVALGWTGLSVPEDYGGLGLGLQELGVLYQELGRVCAPIPLASCAIAADLIARTGTSAQKAEWLPALADGSLRAAVTSPIGDPSIILDAEADLVFVRQEDGSHLAVTSAAVERIAVTDQTRAIGRITSTGDAHSRLEAASTDPLIIHCSLAIACDALGGGDAILERTIDYLKQREQFGRRIGSFQALKHRVADHRSRLVALRVYIENTLANPDPMEASALKAWACEVYADVARDAVQMHGGIGYTWEYACHPWLKRSRLDGYAMGSIAEHYDYVARLLGRG